MRKENKKKHQWNQADKGINKRIYHRVVDINVLTLINNWERQLTERECERKNVKKKFQIKE